MQDFKYSVLAVLASPLLGLLPIPLKKKSSKIKVISVADLFAEIITKVYTHQSISTHYLI